MVQSIAFKAMVRHADIRLRRGIVAGRGTVVEPLSVRMDHAIELEDGRVNPADSLVYMMQQMHDNKYLHLPVVDSDQGTVVGVVNVMEIVQAMAGTRGSSRYV